MGWLVHSWKPEFFLGISFQINILFYQMSFLFSKQCIHKFSIVFLLIVVWFECSLFTDWYVLYIFPRAADWKLDQPDWTGRVRVCAKGKECYIKIEDKSSGE